MTMADYIQEKIEKRRARDEARAEAEARAEDRAWVARMREAQARGEPFDEPFPGSEEAERIKREAIESSFLYRLQRHWIWPHLVIFILVCLVIDVVALGYGLAWLVKYVAGIEGSGTVFWVTTGSLLALGAYWCLYKFIRWWYG